MEASKDINAGPSPIANRMTLMQLAFLLAPPGKRLRGGGLEPGTGVNGAPGLADFEVQRGGLAAAGIPDRGDGVAGGDPLPHLLVEPVVVAVQAEVTVAVIDDGQQAQPGEPVRVHHTSVVDRPDRRAL